MESEPISMVEMGWGNSGRAATLNVCLVERVGRRKKRVRRVQRLEAPWRLRFTASGSGTLREVETRTGRRRKPTIMNNPIFAGIIVAVVLVASGVAMWGFMRARSRKLQQRFGPEYDRALREMGCRWRAEQVLEKREKRVDQLQLRPLRHGDQERFAQHWRLVQADFVDDPRLAFSEADALVRDLMKARGYPQSDFEQRAADISVDHPLVAENYRAAYAIALRHARGEASTEDLRQAMVQYRILFEDLMGDREHATLEVRR